MTKLRHTNQLKLFCLHLLAKLLARYLKREIDNKRACLSVWLVLLISLINYKLRRFCILRTVPIVVNEKLHNLRVLRAIHSVNEFTAKFQSFKRSQSCRHLSLCFVLFIRTDWITDVWKYVGLNAIYIDRAVAIVIRLHKDLSSPWH